MRIVIADDHPILREGLIRTISVAPDFEIVGETGDGKKALELIRDLSPELAVLDISMPGMTGLEIVRKCQQENLQTQFVILTMYKEEEYFNEALDLGVKGYILKENAASDLVECLKYVQSGKYYVSPVISEYLVHRNMSQRALYEDTPSLQSLTPMERRILKLIAANKTSKEIAGELFISYRTVQNHRTNICSKLDLKGHHKLLQFALENKACLSSAVQSADEVNVRDSEKLTEKTPPLSYKHTILFTGIAVMALFVALFLYWRQETASSDLAGFDNNKAYIDNRIAVLPFMNISRDSTVEFICDGITEELITTLSKFDSPKVIARTSVMKYKGTSKGILEISRELRVGIILEGSVQKSGNKLRVSAQLIDATTEEHLWAQNYNRDINDIFAIQTNIAESVAAALKEHFFVDTKKASRQVPAPNHEAHNTYLKGRYFWNKRTYQSIETAISYFERTLEIDPDYAKAYVGLADSYLQLGEWGFMPALDAFSRVDRNVVEALFFDAGLGEVHCTQAAAYHSLAWSWKRAEQEFRMAIELSPNYATARQWYAEYLSTMRRHDEALVEIQRARELDPLSLVINAVEGWLLLCAQEYDLAIEQLLRTSRMDSSFALTDVYLGRAYIGKSMFIKGLAVLKRSREKFPDDPTVLAALGYALAMNGKTEEAKKVIEELDYAAGQHYGLANFKALIYAGLAENDLTIKWLEKAYQDHVPWLSWINVEPAYDHLRADARFVTLIEKMSLSDVQ